jgi:hypothetical protein
MKICRNKCTKYIFFFFKWSSDLSNRDTQHDANDKDNPLFKFNVDLEVSTVRNHLMTRALKVSAKHSTGRRTRSDEDVDRVRMRPKERSPAQAQGYTCRKRVPTEFFF